MREFVIPQYPEGLEKDHNDGRLFVKTIVPFKNKSEREINALVDGLEGLVESPLDIFEHLHFDALYSFIAKLSTLSGDVRKSVSDALCRSTRAMVDLTKRTLESRSSSSSSGSSSQPSSDDAVLQTHNKTLKAHCAAYKIYGFFLHWLVLEQEKLATDQSAAPVAAAAATKGGRGKKKKTTDGITSSWEEADKEKVLTAMIDVLELDLASLWKANLPEEEFLNLFNKVVSSMLENQVNVASKTLRQYLFVMAAQLLSRYQQHTTLIPSLVHLLYRCEHLALPLVELFELIAAEYDAPIVVGEMIRELGKGSASGAKDTGNKNISAFISKLAERIPKAVLPFVGTLAAQLADEAHQIRNGIVQVLGHLISKGFSQDDEDEDGTREKQRESLLALLEERFLDVSSYTRSKVLQTWKDLITERAVPVKMLNSITRQTVLRLADKIAQVRKRAVLLLTAILEYNPYNNALPLALFEQSLQESETKLDALTQAQIERLKQSLEKTTGRRQNDAKSAKKGSRKSKRGTAAEVDDQDEQEGELHEQIIVETDDMDQEEADEAQAGEELAAQEDENSDENREIKNYEKRCETLREIVCFIRLFHQAMPVLTQLLGSKTATDVQETINFFVVANRFQIEAASDGIKKMLPLVWSKDTEIKNAVINAYQLLFLTPPPNFTSEKSVARFVAGNLTRLIGQSTVTELVSFEELVTEFTRKEFITPSTIKCLWSMFAMKMEGTTMAQSRNALVALCYIANVKREIVHDNLAILTSFGLGERWKEDERFAQYTCVALQKLVNSSVADVAPTRFNSSHSLFEQLARIVKESSKSLSRWFPAAEQAINAIYTLSEQPDQVCGTIIKDMTQALRQAPASPISALTKLVFVVGHVALRQLIHLEYIQIELRRRRTLKEKHDEGTSLSLSLSRPMWRSIRCTCIDLPLLRTNTDKKGKHGHGSEAIEEELGVQTATEESEAEFIQQIAERQLVCKNLLSAYAPMIIRICQNTNGEFENSTLRSAAVLSLCKFMCTSATFCDANLRLLFTVLEKAPEPFVRSDIVIALSDLASRHHNLIAGWMTKLHSRLRDSDASVRKNSLMVLSHLILNEMIKPGDHISKVAQCLEDEDPRIAGLARLFFQEQTSKQVNSIYNSLPDIISSLSGSNEITKDGFKRIMQYLFQFVTQERHTESLVDKLCLRFRDCQDIASSYDIAYCLTLLSYTDKPVKKLVERFKLYQNLLIHNEIYECFLATIAKMKKTARVELRSIVDELEAKIEAWHSAEVQEDGQLYAASADIAISSGASAVAATPATASSSSSSVASSSSSSKKAPSTRGRRGAAAAAKPAAKAKAPATRKSTRATSTRGRKAKQYDSSDDEEENASTDGNDSDIDMLV